MRRHHDHQAPRDAIHAGEGIDRRRLLKTAAVGVAGAALASVDAASRGAKASTDVASTVASHSGQAIVQ